jgi:excisionase family DNA binding protein
MASTEKETPELLTIDEAAHALRQSRETVYRKIRSGELPAVRIGSGPRAPIRVSSFELACWLYGSSPRRNDPATREAESAARKAVNAA